MGLGLGLGLGFRVRFRVRVRVRVPSACLSKTQKVPSTSTHLVRGRVSRKKYSHSKVPSHNTHHSDLLLRIS